MADIDFMNDPRAKMIFIKNNSEILTQKNKSDILQVIDDNADPNYTFNVRKIFVDQMGRSEDTRINLKVLYECCPEVINVIYDLVKNRRESLRVPFM